jgi:hypothetical protein
MGGVLPFGCIFIQLFFILNSIWYVVNLPKPARFVAGVCQTFRFYLAILHARSIEELLHYDLPTCCYFNRECCGIK